MTMISFFLQKCMMTLTSNFRLFRSIAPRWVSQLKAKVMIIKSKKITHGSFMYNNQCLEKFSSFKYIGIIASRKWIIASRIGLLEDGKLIMSLKTIVSLSIFIFGVKRSSCLRLLSPLLSYTYVKFGAAVYPKSHGGRLRLFKRNSYPTT